MATNRSLLPEIGPDGLPQEAPAIAYTEKIIEEEQLQLRKYIEENYSKIRDVERELANLNLELKLTAGSKKAALEHMRKKIELANERIQAAKIKEEQARKAWEEASKAVKDEEAIKQKLCDDLSRLVQESNNIQYARLEELKRRLESLNPSRPSVPNYDLPASKSAEEHVKSNTTPPVVNSQNQLPSSEGEGRGKKKLLNPGRAKGSGIVPKGRGSPGPGWTGAGFDVDTKT